MSCQECLEHIDERIDHALEAPARVRLDAHLRGCADCRLAFERARAVIGLSRVAMATRPRTGEDAPDLDTLDEETADMIARVRAAIEGGGSGSA